MDLAELLTQHGEVLVELHHDDDEGASGEHTRRPEERVEDGRVAVQPREEHGVALPLAGVVVTGDLLVGFQTLRDVHHHGLHDPRLLLALGDEEALDRETDM